MTTKDKIQRSVLPICSLSTKGWSRTTQKTLRLSTQKLINYARRWTRPTS